MRLRGAVFDIDGTLLDSMPIWDTIGEAYLRSIGGAPRENLREVFQSMSLYQAACYYRSAYGVTLSTEEIMAGVNAMLERYYQQEAPLKPGAAALLGRLDQAGVRLCVATATDGHLVEAALSRQGVLSCFQEIFTCAQVGHGKDQPHIFEAALRCLGTERGETLVFEDALYAIRTAKGAGFPVAAVYDAHEKEQHAVQALADLYLPDLTQFETIWRARYGEEGAL